VRKEVGSQKQMHTRAQDRKERKGVKINAEAMEPGGTGRKFITRKKWVPGVTGERERKH